MTTIQDWLATQDAQERNDRAHANLLAPGPSPDEAARHDAAGTLLGIPGRAVAAYPTLERAADVAKVASTLQSSPALTEWLANQDNARVARDDVHPLSLFDRVGQTILALSPATWPLTIAREYQQGQQDIEQNQLAYQLQQYSMGRGPSYSRDQVRGMLDRLNTLRERPGANDWGPFMIGPTARLLPQILGSFGAGWQGITKGAADEWRSQHPFSLVARPGADWLDWTKTIAALPLSSVATGLAAVGKGGEGYIGFGYEQEAGQFFDQAVRDGVPVEIAARHADQYAQIATALEFVGDALGLKVSGVAGGVTKIAGAVAGRLMGEAASEGVNVGTRYGLAWVARRAGVRLLATAADEGGVEALQQIAQSVTEQQGQLEGEGKPSSPEAAVASILADPGKLGDAISQAIQSFVIGAQGGAGFASVGVALNLPHDLGQVRVARQQQAVFTALNGAAKDSKLRGRAPDRFADAVETMTRAGPLEEARIDAGRFVEFYQEQGQDPFKVADALPGVGREKLQQALDAGGEVAVPMGTFAAKIAGTSAYEGLAPHVRIGPDARTPAEVAAARTLGVDLARTAMETANQQEAETKTPSVEDRVIAELDKADAYRPQTNRMIGRMISSGVSTIATRAQLDPNALLDRIGFSVKGPLEGEAPIEEAPAPTAAKIAQAEEMDAKGESPEAISKETGLDRAPDGGWRTAVDFEALRGEPPLNQAKGQTGPRGSISFARGAGGAITQATVRLYEARDLSTLLHESGHLFLEVLRLAASEEGASAQIKADWKTALDWFGVTEEKWAAMSLDEQRPYHEQWARGFELYLREGKAPSLSLRDAFSAFKTWLAQIYKTALGLHVDVSDEVRGVFDRILATDDAIAEARNAQGAAAPIPRELFGVTEGSKKTLERIDNAYARYVQNWDRARIAAEDEVRVQAVGALMADRTRWWRGEERRFRRAVELDVDTQPIRRAFDWLAYGIWRHGQAPAGLEPIRLDPQTIAEQYGEAMLASLPKALVKGDAKELIALANETRKTLKLKAPPRLTDAVRKLGVAPNDANVGDVIAILGDVREKKGARATVREGGLFLDGAGGLIQRLWEDGWFGAGPGLQQGVAHAGEPARSIESIGAQARGFRQRGGIPGSEGRLSASGGTADATRALEGAPEKVIIPGQGEIYAGPVPEARRAAAAYMRAAGLDYQPPQVYAKVDVARARRIADAFDNMEHAPDDPEVRAAYEALARETLAQYRSILKTGLKVEFIDIAKGDPYAASPRLAIEDIRNNNHFWVFATADGYGDGELNADARANNPMLAETDEMISGRRALVNDIFRVVHDYFGHAKDGVGMRARGEENAWRSHAAMYSPLARAAMTTETRGQNSWLNYGPHGEFNRTASAVDTIYAEQKIGLMPEWVMEEGRADDDVFFQTERPTVREFLDKLAGDQRNEPAYRLVDEGLVDQRRQAEEMDAWFRQRGVDLEADDLRARLERLAGREDSRSIDPDLAASIFGFDSGEQLLDALAKLEPRKQEIDAELKRRMLAEFGDPFADGSIMDEALKAAHGAVQAKAIEIEFDAMERAKAGTRPISRVAEDIAERQVRQMTVRQIRKFDWFLANERRQAKAALDALAKGDVVTARQAKQRQLVNFHLYRLARAAADEMDKATRYLKKFDKNSVREHIDGDYLDQIDGLLDQYELRPIGAREYARRISLAQWAAAMEEKGLGHMVNVDPAVLQRAGQTPFDRLSLDDARGLVDTVKNIEHLGKLKDRLLAKEEQRKFGEVVGGLTDRMEKTGPISDDVRRNYSPNVIERAQDKLREAHAQMTRMEFLFRYLDGGANGPLYQALWSPFAHAADKESGMTRDTAKRMTEIWSKYTRRERALQFKRRIDMPDLPVGGASSYTKIELISIGLNLGSEGNLEAMVDGFGWAQQSIKRGAPIDYAAARAQIIKALDRVFEKRDWETVQEVLDLIGSFRDEAFQLEEDLTGVRPEAVAAATIETKYGVFKGGYYPLKYDRSRDMRVERVEAKQEVSELWGSNWSRPMTRKGHLEARKGSGGRPVKLSITVASEHIQNVIHDIAYRRAVVDADRIITDPRFTKSFVDVAGMAMYKQLRPWLQAIAADRIDPSAWMWQFLQKLRGNAAIAVMGYRLSTALQQIPGLLQAVPMLGGDRMAGALLKIFSRPDQMWAKAQIILNKSEFMRTRMHTFDRDAREAIERMSNNDPLYHVRHHAFALVGAFDWAISATVWTAAYDKAIEGDVKGIVAGDEAGAVAYADSAVRTTQSAGLPQDLPAIMRGNQVNKLLTMFMSYWSVLYNWTSEQVMDVRKGRVGPVAFMANMALIYIVAPLLGEALAGRWAPKEGESDDDRNLRLALVPALTAFQTVPVVRDMANAVGTGYDYKLSPVETGPGAITKAARTAIEGKTFSTEYNERTAATALGYALGLPSQSALDVARTTGDLLDGSGGVDPAQQN